jgi:DNA-binding MarR family transcriptional regulator
MTGRAADKPHPRVSKPIRQEDYERLAEFRYVIRAFLEFSQEKAKLAGLAPQQHQALLAIKGFPGGQPVTVGDLAERLRIRHHSAVELVNRLCDAGLLTRGHDAGDQRRVLLTLTRRAEKCLAELSVTHLDELDRIEPTLRRILKPGVRPNPPRSSPSRPA